MALYTEFWKQTFNELLVKISSGEPTNFTMPVPELPALGRRESSPYNGTIIIWVGKTEHNSNTSVFRNLKDVVDEMPRLVNRIPGELILRVTNNDTLEVNYQPISFDLLVKRYEKLPIQIKKDEIYKWELVKSFQDHWVAFTEGKITFTDFLTKIEFRNLIYYDSLGVIKHMVRDKPDEYEKILLRLYDENISLQDRIGRYISDAGKLYFDLQGHGKNHFQDERTIATLLAFRYPEKYTFFKDSFYSVLSKGLGIKPAPKNEKLLHYYSVVNDFLETTLPLYPEVVNLKNSLLNSSCYVDENNQLLAQDIFYKTIEANPSVLADSMIEDELTPSIPQKEIISMSPLNCILYGPPGTGKTYHTINKAVTIANPLFNLQAATRSQLKAEYERLVKEGQIEFVTFHQSMSYEDFIEGIKPVEPKEADTFLKYEIREGIFKRLAERASKVPDAKPTGFSISDDQFQGAGFYKLSLGDTSNPDDDQIYDWCIKNGYMALGWGGANNFIGKTESDIQKMVPAQLEKFAAQAVNYFIHYIKSDDYIIVTYGNLQFRAIGKVTGNYEYIDVPGLGVHQFRKVEWLLKDVELPYEEIYNKQFSQQSIYRLDKREIKKDFLVKKSGDIVENDQPKNYVLIIDEINRGNVSQIFGDLITLIEDDKRTGKNEALSVTLPYSKKSFSVPPNLYIIGTMNTADRSVEALDTALRRRFVFEPMMPIEGLLSAQRKVWELWWKHPTILWHEEPYKSEEKQLYELLGVESGFGHDDKLWNIIKPLGKNENQIQQFNSIPIGKDGINLETMLSEINERLTALLTKDHTIGHAWLMDVRSLRDLQLSFKNKILPLLQEFFYNDFAKIGLVLGDAFVAQQKVAKKIFAKFTDEKELAADYEDKIIYTLKDPLELSQQDFQSIYL